MKAPIKVGGVSFAWPPAQSPVADDPAHWSKRGAERYAAGDRVAAAQAYTRYLDAPVRNPTLRKIVDAMAGEDLVAADKLVRGVLARQPGDLVAYRLFGQITLRRGDTTGAETIFRRSLELVPDFAPLRYELALALSGQGKSEAALAELDRLLRVDAHNLAYRALRADTLVRLGDVEGATQCYAALTAEQPGHAALWVAYGQVLRTLRRRDEAIDAFRRAIRLAPAFGEAWWNLANLKTGALTRADAEALRTAITSGRGSAADLFHLHFALARALEESGSFEASFTEYRTANAARRALLPPTGPQATGDFVRRAVKLFTHEFLAARHGMGEQSDAPVFILGMPRSGSTLLEQILAQHPAIEGTQELPDLTIVASELDRMDGQPGGYPEVLARLHPDRLREIGRDYLERTRRRRRTDRPFFIDKQPANWLHVGLIKLILPNAHVIDTRRDAVGCCLSMFRQHFARGAAFTYSLEELAAEYRAYHTLMTHFDSVLPGVIYRVELDGLVRDVEGTVRALLAHLGLPFAPECLSFFDSPRAVYTPSSEQVRRPIHQESAELVRGFEPYIGELKTLLGDLAHR